MYIRRISLILIACLMCHFGMARENAGMPLPTPENAGIVNGSGSGKTAVECTTSADCSAASANIELNINNVRARLMTGGDMWWDLQNSPRYEVPKIPAGSDEVSVHSLFAGALWVGGIDQLGQLKVAAQTYRQTGNDFWPGPLDDNGQICAEICNNFDKFWEVRGDEVADYLARLEAAGGSEIAAGQIPPSILQWPARNNRFFSAFDLPEDKNLAPFWDANDNGFYEPDKGDYPVIDPDVEGVYADQMIWYIFNDKGNIHTETGGEAIGLEIGALAFAFATNDEINNMTFYKYSIDNKSTQPLDSVYFGQWVDADLGFYRDDYVGCVPEEGVGIVYNGEAIDAEYGENPPMVGVDFFQGPRKEVGRDDNGDPIYDTLGMSAFVYYNNDFSVQGNPENASHIYGYLAGVWKDGTPFTFGGDGKGGDTPVSYMFPDDPPDPQPAWSECSENNPVDDRRFLQSSGPFRLNPGAFNEVIVGVVWVRKGVQYPCPSFEPLLRADKKAQALFDNNFEILNGPDAPTISVREMDQELILSLWNDTDRSNNAFESYAEEDPVLKAQEFDSTFYRFQGYKIYQLADATVSPAEYNDTDRAREIAIIDIKDDIKRLVNYEFEGDLGIIPEIKVDANDSGIRRTFRISEDLFALGDKKLINNKKYYFSAISYAYNAHPAYDPAAPADTAQLTPYLEGRNNIKVYVGIPHLPLPQQGGTVLNAEYGDGPIITRIDGIGNNGQFLELDEASKEAILANGSIAEPVYESANGPVDVTIYDPFKIPNDIFYLDITNADPSNRILSGASSWTLTNERTGDVYRSEIGIGRPNEQSIGGWQNGSLGFTINVNQQALPSGNANNFIGGELAYRDLQNQWLSFLGDQNGVSLFNWIRSGSFTTTAEADYNDNGDPFYDPNAYYGSVLEGRIAPYALVNSTQPDAAVNRPNISPGCSDCTDDFFPTNNLNDLQSANIVFTADKSLWTQCVVLEMGESEIITQGAASKNDLRRSPSWDKDSGFASPVSSLTPGSTYFIGGNSAASISYAGSGGEVTVRANNFFTAEVAAFNAKNGAEVYDAKDVGRSWFPGYAINPETGERLNMAFSENSFFQSDNGADMLWNPTSTLFTQNAFNFRMGGMHYVYVMNSKYDGGARYRDMLVESALVEDGEDVRPIKNNFYKEAMWVTVPFLTPGFSLTSEADGFIPSDITMKMRVARPYTQTSDNTVRYKLDFSQVATLTNDAETAKSALDSVRVVPNPYYAFSEYETSQLDNRVRFTNLPTRCDISIFTVDGTFIKSFKIDNTGFDTAAGGEVGKTTINSQDWDLKNFKNIPIASGMYLIHVNAPDIGESKTIKWFCISRPVDLDIF